MFVSIVFLTTDRARERREIGKKGREVWKRGGREEGSEGGIEGGRDGGR